MGFLLARMSDVTHHPMSHITSAHNIPTCNTILRRNIKSPPIYNTKPIFATIGLCIIDNALLDSGAFRRGASCFGFAIAYEHVHYTSYDYDMTISRRFRSIRWQCNLYTYWKTWHISHMGEMVTWFQDSSTNNINPMCQSTKMLYIY